MLVISGERKREEEKEGAKYYVRMEGRMGKFMRKFALQGMRTLIGSMRNVRMGF